MTAGLLSSSRQRHEKNDVAAYLGLIERFWEQFGREMIHSGTSIYTVPITGLPLPK